MRSVFAITASVLMPAIWALPTPNAQGYRQVACADKPYPQNLNCPGAAAGGRPSPQAGVPQYQPPQSTSSSSPRSKPKSPSPIGSDSTPACATLPYPQNLACETKQSEKPSFTFDSQGISVTVGTNTYQQGPGDLLLASGLGTYHKTSDGSIHIEGEKGTIDKLRDGKTVYQGPSGYIETGPNGMKLRPGKHTHD